MYINDQQMRHIQRITAANKATGEAAEPMRYMVHAFDDSEPTYYEGDVIVARTSESGALSITCWVQVDPFLTDNPVWADLHQLPLYIPAQEVFYSPGTYVVAKFANMVTAEENERQLYVQMAWDTYMSKAAAMNEQLFRQRPAFPQQHVGRASMGNVPSRLTDERPPTYGQSVPEMLERFNPTGVRNDGHQYEIVPFLSGPQHAMTIDKESRTTDPVPFERPKPQLIAKTTLEKVKPIPMTEKVEAPELDESDQKYFERHHDEPTDD